MADKADKVKEIVEKMQKRTPQKAKNPSLVQKEIKKELKKEDVAVEKKEQEKKEQDSKKEKVASIVAKVKKALESKNL